MMSFGHFRKPPPGYQLVLTYNEQTGTYDEELVKVPPIEDFPFEKFTPEYIRDLSRKWGGQVDEDTTKSEKLASTGQRTSGQVEKDDDDDKMKPWASGQGSSGQVDENREMTKSEKKRAKRARNKASKKARKAAVETKA